MGLQKPGLECWTNGEDASMSRGFSQTRIDAEIRQQPSKPGEEWQFSSKGTLDFTHGIHPYVAAMNPHLAKELLRRVVPPEGRILDPFVGGGAVLVEALLRRVAGEGID